MSDGPDPEVLQARGQHAMDPCARLRTERDEALRKAGEWETLANAAREALKEQPCEAQLLRFLGRVPPSWLEPPNISAQHAFDIVKTERDEAIARAEKAEAEADTWRGCHEDAAEDRLALEARLDVARALVARWRRATKLRDPALDHKATSLIFGACADELDTALGGGE